MDDTDDDARKQRVLTDLLAAATGEEVVDVDIAAPELQKGGEVLFTYRVAGAADARTRALPLATVVDALGGGEDMGEADEAAAEEAAAEEAAADIAAQHGATVVLLDGEAYVGRAREVLGEIQKLVAGPAFFEGDDGVDALDHYLEGVGLRALYGPPVVTGVGATPAALQVVERRPDVVVAGVSFNFIGVGPTAADALAQLAKGVARLRI